MRGMELLGGLRAGIDGLLATAGTVAVLALLVGGAILVGYWFIRDHV